MKLSIWQQWSSNHSANFTVVGVFETSDAARDAKERLMTIFNDILAWANEHPDEAKEISLNYHDNHAPPELVWRERLDIASKDWYGSLLEWLLPTHEEDNVSASVSAIENVLLVSSPVSTWLGDQPIFQIVESTGAAAVYHSVEPTPWHFTMTLTCTCPGEEVALAIGEDLQAKKRTPPPWVIYYGSMLVDYPEELVANIQEALDYQRRFWKREVTPSVIYTPLAKYWRMAANCTLSFNSVVVEGRIVLIDRLYMDPPGLAALVKWVRSKGCTVEMSFVQHGGDESEWEVPYT
jgi:hypothetical protein